ncbi:hypothetical protein LTR56_010784 [Elasticomyces elasticus]|nr:hypothetical protein LTR56_010784 [Elasticomyces elasticus]KAK3667809.1 hypothetical protein LTR22_001254 [Elasticomyces elasticus]KAK4932198.1 hypothetical protein LTR49_001495 [Elasticomyces elasticus]KAK5763422.1 hypothetical protein LTS12_006393 [Elasticomyces elasticus]
MAPKKSNAGVDKFDRYWRRDNTKSKSMTNDELSALADNAGYPINGQTPKYTILFYVDRIHRGLLCYHICTNAELEKFAEDRNLDVALEPFRRSSYISALDEADREPFFGLLFDLPPELRKMVYKLYMADFPEKLYCPTQPPLSRVNRQLRREVLPDFCQRTTIILILHPHVGEDRQTKLRFDGDDTNFLHNLGDNEQLAFRNVHLTLAAPMPGFSKHRVWLHAKSAENIRGIAVKGYTHALDPDALVDADLDENLDSWHKSLQRHAVSGLPWKPVWSVDAAGLGVDDVYALRSVFEKIWRS